MTGWSGRRRRSASTPCCNRKRRCRRAARRPPRRSSPTIAFDDCAFLAIRAAAAQALDGLSFSVKVGERIGIVGPSGSGKSTIAALLLRLYDPQSGTVRIGGIDLQTLDPEAVRGQIAVVRQDTYLFHGTVDDNLRLGKPDAARAEIIAAARAANAHDFIAALPQGYATLIGERGLRLSGGQRQRLAIARALLRDAPILILDEALSSVDAENEAIIQSALDRLMAGRTTLILAHRLSSVIDADRILVLDRGRVVESGTHGELMRRDGAYRRLMGAQAEERGDRTLPFLPRSAAQAADIAERANSKTAAATPRIRSCASSGWIGAAPPRRCSASLRRGGGGLLRSSSQERAALPPISESPSSARSLSRR